MRLIRRVLGLAVILLAPVLLGSGCSGINASGGVSPATFLLPGLGQNPPVNHPGRGDDTQPEVLLAARSK